MNEGVIHFFSPEGPYGDFSNHAAYPIELHGKRWPTTEHYFQAQKFAGTEHEESIRRASSSQLAAQMGRDRNHPMRTDWQSVKENLMREALYAKFTQHPSIGKLLLSTANATLVEHATDDAYWGDGMDGQGQNRLGVLLMELREILRAKTHADETRAT